jgi:hypothetical protein
MGNRGKRGLLWGAGVGEALGEGLFITEGLHEPDDMVFYAREGGFGGFVFDIVDFPVLDAAGPLREGIEHHGEVFGLFQGDGDGRVLQVVIGQRGGFGGGFVDGDISFMQGVAGFGSEVSAGVRDMDAKSSGRGEPMESFRLSMKVKKSLCEAAPVDIARTDEEGALFVEHLEPWGRKRAQTNLER